MSKFKVGDLVIGNQYRYAITNKDWVGKVTAVFDDGYIRVQSIGKLDLTGYIVREEDFDNYLDDNQVVIALDPKNPQIVIARHPKTGVLATAKCNKKDPFDFYTGAKLALERLEEKTKTPYWSGKVVYIGGDSSPFLTLGKVYLVEEGYVIDDTGTPLNFAITLGGRIRPFKGVLTVSTINGKHKFVEFKGGAV